MHSHLDGNTVSLIVFKVIFQKQLYATFRQNIALTFQNAIFIYHTQEKGCPQLTWIS